MKSIGSRSLFTATLSTCVVFSVAACSGDPDPGNMLGSGGAVSSGGAQLGSGGAVSGTGGSTNSGGNAPVGSGGAVASGGASPDGSGGGDASGGSESGSGGDSGGGDVVQSKGCGVVGGATMLTAGSMAVDKALATSRQINIQSGGMNRNYIIDIPQDYDANKPYRLIFSWYQFWGSSTANANGQYPAHPGPNFDAENYAFFGLRRAATEAGESAIFIAPAGDTGATPPWNYDRDVVFFDDLLKVATDNLCIDENRVFSTGFSFGAMMSHALSRGRASKLRGVVAMAPANYNFPQPAIDGGNVAYFGITGMDDPTCEWVANEGQKTGGKYCVLEHAENNGCTGPANIPTAMIGSKDHLCVDMEGCDADYPVKVCTFGGNHTPSPVADGSAPVANGSNGGDDGKTTFVPPMAWEFISQL